MARVNDGTIQFSLDKNSSMEDLIRETFYVTLALKRDYVSGFEVDKKTKEVLAKTGRNRMQESEYVGDEGFDFNPYDDWEQQQNVREDFLYAKDDDTMLRYMEAISYMDNEDWKKAIIVQFMKRGLHMKYRNSFRLQEKLITSKNDEISKEDKKKFEETNKFINSVIEKRISEYEPFMEKQWKDFFSRIKSCTDYYDDFKTYLTNRASMIVDMNTSVKDFMRYIKDSAYVGCELDVNANPDDVPNYGEPYLSTKRQAVRDFNDALVDFRDNVNKFININIEEGCKLLEISASRIRGDNVYACALHHMYEIFGIQED